MRADLRTDPAVMRIVKTTGFDCYCVIGRLHRLWSWVDAHSSDGFIEFATIADVDALVDAGASRFGDALVQVGWLEELSTGLRIPKYELHNGQSAKKRAMKSERQARWRDAKSVDAPVDASPSTREEKRRVKTPSPSPSPAGKGDGRKNSAKSNGHTALKLPQAWWSDPEKARRAGEMLGLAAAPGESLPDFTRRLNAEIERRKREVVAH